MLIEIFKGLAFAVRRNVSRFIIEVQPCLWHVHTKLFMQVKIQQGLLQHLLPNDSYETIFSIATKLTKGCSLYLTLLSWNTGLSATKVYFDNIFCIHSPVYIPYVRKLFESYLEVPLPLYLFHLLFNHRQAWHDGYSGTKPFQNVKNLMTSSLWRRSNLSEQFCVSTEVKIRPFLLSAQFLWNLAHGLIMGRWFRT